MNHRFFSFEQLELDHSLKIKDCRKCKMAREGENPELYLGHVL